MKFALRMCSIPVAALMAASAGAGCGKNLSGGNGSADARPWADGSPRADGGNNPDGGSGVGKGLIWAHGDYLTNNRKQLAVYRPGDPLPVTQPTLVLPAGDTGEIASGSGVTSDLGPFDISSDGLLVAFAADIDTTGSFDLYVANTDGTGLHRVVDASASTVGATADVDAVRFSPDGTRLALRADLDSSDQDDVYVVDSKATDATPTRVSPAHGNAATNLDAAEMMWSADSSKIIVTGDFTENTYQEMWLTDLRSASPAPTTIISHDQILATTTGTKGATRLVAEVGGRILFKSRLAADNVFRLSMVDEDGQNLGTLPNSEIKRADESTASIGAVGLSPDGSMIAFGADETATAYDIWLMPTSGNRAPTKLTTGVTAGSEAAFNEPLKWSPDGQSIAFVADYAGGNNKFEPYVVPAFGGGQTRLAAIAGDQTQDAITVAWAGDSSELFTLADQRAPNDTEMFALDPTRTDQDMQLAFAVVAGGDFNGIRASASP